MDIDCAQKGKKESKLGFNIFHFIWLSFLWYTRLLNRALFRSFSCYLFTPRWLGIRKERFTPQLRPHFMTMLTRDFQLSVLRSFKVFSSERTPIWASNVNKYGAASSSLHSIPSHARMIIQSWLNVASESGESNKPNGRCLASCNFVFNIHLIKLQSLVFAAMFTFLLYQQIVHSRDMENEIEEKRTVPMRTRKEIYSFQSVFACMALEMKTR